MKTNTKKINKKTPKVEASELNKQYLVVTNFTDGTYQNDIFEINTEHTEEDIVQHRLEQYNQFTANDNSHEPKVKNINLFEITTIHTYNDLDILFNDAKKRFLENKENEVKEEIPVE